MTLLEKQAAGTRRKKERLTAALNESMKRERTKGWLRKKTTRPLHPRTQLLESSLSSLTEGQKAGKSLARAKKLQQISGPAARGLATFLTLGLAPAHTTVTGAKLQAETAQKSGKASKVVAQLIRKLITRT